MKAIGVIPARYGSTRFPGKPLAEIRGKPMIQWVYESAVKAKSLDRVIIATDDVRIMRVVWNFGGQAMLTSKKAKSGTDRVAETAKKMSADIIVNIQGDEPLISAKTIDQVVRPLQKDKRLLMSTAASVMNPSDSDAQISDVVKVVVDQMDNALYFSRSPIPFHRTAKGFQEYYRHCGIYGYRRDFLLRFTKWKQTPLETAESLEQLRALEHGIRIRVVQVKQFSLGVDTKNDLEKLKGYL
jgi:3-deoxy-manno-octulosonate cytidylyltransferase (CMP-KDO synthetase)